MNALTFQPIGPRPWSEADVFCAKAKRQQQKFSVRKRSGSNKSFLCESEAAATNVFCAKAKRQQQSAQSERKSTTRYGDELKNTT
ncbi:hypothetical protein [Lysinibacillus sphaericus]|uniref:hypothetical protein n=1 Tax=Lysinibacillus sphaericus TaxID=1421 RepID=UPI001CBFF793|nr:hypothetical protein [Lysinibacillus sphaericus]